MSSAYFGRFESYYPQTSQQLRVPVPQYSHGNSVGYSFPDFQYKSTQAVEGRTIGGPYVGRQFISVPEAWGYKRRVPTVGPNYGTAPPHSASRMATTLPVPASPTNVFARGEVPPSPKFGASLVPDIPIAQSFERTQRHGYTRNRVGGYWGDVDSTHWRVRGVVAAAVPPV